MSELYELLRSSTDHTGLPVMRTNQFLNTIEKFGKEEFRKVLAEYITNEKPPFPLAEFNKEKVVTNFRKLEKADFTDYLSVTENDRVIEKYDDYKYSYS